MNAPALPVHDSFIVHHGYAEIGEVEETMRRAFTIGSKETYQ